MSERFDIERVIQNAVRARMGEIIVEEADNAVKRVNARMAESADQMAMSVLRLYDVQQCAARVIITVNKGAGENNNDR